jgi:cysteine desulfuration protein SufE
VLYIIIGYSSTQLDNLHIKCAIIKLNCYIAIQENVKDFTNFMAFARHCVIMMMMQNVKEKEQQQVNSTMQSILDDFSLFEDWEDKYSYLIELGASMLPLEDAYKTDTYKVRGCTSQVWIVHERRDGLHYFRADSDAHIVRGLVALLMRIASGLDTATLMSLNIHDFFAQLGLKEHLSPSRSNGFFAMVESIKAAAA